MTLTEYTQQCMTLNPLKLARYGFSAFKLAGRTSLRFLQYQLAVFRTRNQVRHSPSTSHAGIESNAPIAVAFHAYHLDISLETLKRIKEFQINATRAVDLIVTTTPERQRDIASQLQKLGLEAKLITVDNIGRDIWPFIQICQQGVLDKYSLVLKIHTKSQRRIARGVMLSDQTIFELLNATLVSKLLQQQDRTPIFVSTFARYIGRTSSWGTNIPRTVELARSAGLVNLPTFLRFPAGTVFWASASFISIVKQLPIVAADFEGEPTPDDGGTPHAFERLFGILASSVGSGVISVEKIMAQGDK